MMNPTRRETSLTAAMIALAPVLFCQGKYVRRVTPRLPEAAGPRTGECGSGPSLRLLILGDSAAAGVGVDTQEQALIGWTLAPLKSSFKISWKVEATTGATTRSTIARLKALPPEPFDAVAISLGVNEVTAGRRVRRWLSELDELAGLLRSKFGIRRMLWSGVPAMHEFPSLPQPLRWYLGARARMLDAVLLSWTQSQSDCDFIAAPVSNYAALMASDGFHPGPKVYELWGEQVANCIVAMQDSTLSKKTRDLKLSGERACVLKP